METAQITREKVNHSSVAKELTFDLPRIFGTSWEDLQFSYYAVMVFTIIAGSCISGIAAALILSTNAPTWQLAACAALAMFNNTTAIGNMPVKWVVWSFVISLIGNIALIAMNL